MRANATSGEEPRSARESRCLGWTYEHRIGEGEIDTGAHDPMMGGPPKRPTARYARALALTNANGRSTAVCQTCDPQLKGVP